MPIRFTLDSWSACAPGLEGAAAWRSWLENPLARPQPSGKAPLQAVPAAVRRRLEPLGRLAFQAAWECRPDAADCATVFCSRYGELSRPLDLLRSIAAAEAMSPMQFSLSVHNATSALYSIARTQRLSAAAVAAGEETVEAGFVEALGLLHDGAREVMVVYYEEPPPDVYGPVDTADFARAWACQISSSAGAGISLESTAPRAHSNADTELPADLATLRFLISPGRPGFEHATTQRSWQWLRHD